MASREIPRDAKNGTGVRGKDPRLFSIREFKHIDVGSGSIRIPGNERLEIGLVH